MKLGPAQKTRFLDIAWYIFHVTDNYYDVNEIPPASLYTLESKYN